jgi:hypothetical protein
MCAKNATPGCAPSPSEPVPMKKFIANHSPITNQAGNTRRGPNKNHNRKTGLMTVIGARGKRTMYPPSAPAIAPEAPTIGIVLEGSTKIWVAAAANPLNR